MSPDRFRSGNFVGTVVLQYEARTRKYGPRKAPLQALAMLEGVSMRGRSSNEGIRCTSTNLGVLYSCLLFVELAGVCLSGENSPSKGFIDRQTLSNQACPTPWVDRRIRGRQPSRAGLPRCAGHHAIAVLERPRLTRSHRAACVTPSTSVAKRPYRLRRHRRATPLRAYHPGSFKGIAPIRTQKE